MTAPCSGDGVQGSNDGSSAAQPAGTARPPADGGDVEALLQLLSQFRHSVTADLSAAAGAMEAGRADVASEVLEGARSDLADLRERARRPSRIAVGSVLVAAGAPGPPAGGDAAPASIVAAADQPAGRRSALRRWQGKVLTGALAAALAATVVPHVGGGHRSHPSAAAAQAIDFRLVSSEFTNLTASLLAASPRPAEVLDAGQRWQLAVSRSLPDLATQVSAAQQLVGQLREEETLLQAAPFTRISALRSAAHSLELSAQTLLAELRRLADIQVLASLPATITPLPLAGPVPAPSTSTAEAAKGSNPSGTSTAPNGAGTGPAAGAPTAPNNAGVPGTGPLNGVPAPAPVPTSIPSLTVPPLPLPKLPVDPGAALPSALSGLGGTLLSGFATH